MIICPRCGARIELSNGKCYNCGYDPSAFANVTPDCSGYRQSITNRQWLESLSDEDFTRAILEKIGELFEEWLKTVV